MATKDPASKQPLFTSSVKTTAHSKMAVSRCAPSVVVCLTSAIIAAISSVAFAITFQKALAGFSRQVNAFVKVGDYSAFILHGIISVFALLFLGYLVFITLAGLRYFNNCLNKFGVSVILFFSTFGSQAFLVCWVLALCLVSSITLVYFFFIGSIYAFCGMLDSQCFDFKVLLPAIVRTFSNKNVDLTFCQEKKELLCNRENNQIWSFGLAFVFGLLAFGGSLLIQNCLVYVFGKRQIKVDEKQKNYEIELTPIGKE